jgi:hypothetical protein
MFFWCQSDNILNTTKKTKAREAGFIWENDDVSAYRSQGQRPHPTLDDVLHIAQL